MIISFHPQFKKSYKKRIAPNPRLALKTRERILLFQKNPRHPLLQDHLLIGAKKRLRAFSVTGDIRIVYYPRAKDGVVLLDIGTHNQVY